MSEREREAERGNGSAVDVCNVAAVCFLCVRYVG